MITPVGTPIPAFYDEIATLTSAQAALTFGSGGDSVLNEALAGDTYRYYYWVHIERAASASRQYRLEFNGVSGSGYSTVFDEGGVFGSTNATHIELDTVTNETIIDIRGFIEVPSGLGLRFGRWLAKSEDGNLGIRAGSFTWADGAEMTEMAFVVDTGTDAEKFGIGSFARLRRSTLGT